MADPRDEVSVERVIPAPPEKIFELLADPRAHRTIDGSGTLRDAPLGVPARLSLGANFGMGMKLGVPYKTNNEVIEFEDNRRIAWQTTMNLPGFPKLLGGRIWRYELEPVDGGTRVRETWDMSKEKIKAPVRPARGKAAKDMAKTLERIEALLVEPGAPGGPGRAG
jgi:uncharacterized protein YndB with AHSA1/START domain